MASAALGACGAGPPSLSQRLCLDQILDSVESLRGNDPHAAVEAFEDFAAALGDNLEAGRVRALSAISGFAGVPDTPQMLLRIAGAMAAAQGPANAKAAAEIAYLAKTLGLPAPAPPADDAKAAKAGAGPRSVIVLGNEKGGTGKSTTVLHLAVYLMAQGHEVGTVDLDGHQGTLSRYIANRRDYAARDACALAVPRHCRIAPSASRDRTAAHAEERTELQAALENLSGCRFILLDTPGSHTNLSRLGLDVADTLITPMNDSFLDLDVLARIDRQRREIVEPSAYGRLVLDENDRRRARGRALIDWIVIRNRLAHIDARNTREMDKLLRLLSGRMGFRLHPGLSERVVFRELFYNGLTLLDPPARGQEDRVGARGPAGHARARHEIEGLIAALGLETATLQ